MKYILTIFCFVVVALGLKANAQGTIISATYIDSCSASRLPMGTLIDISGSATTMFCFIETNFGDGSALDTSTISYTGVGYFAHPWDHNYTTVGTYTIKHVLFCGSARLDSLSQSHTIACTYIGGELYHDVNSDCVFSPGENQITGPATIEVDSAGTVVDTVFGWGQWWYMAHATATTVYKFRLLSPPAAGFTMSCPGSGIITYTYVPTTSAITGLDFGFNCNPTPAYDYSLSYSRALRGASSPGANYINLYAANNGCHTGSSTVTLNVSPKYSITTTGITPVPASVSGNTVVWTLTGLSNGYVYLHVPLTPKSGTNNGDTACNYAIITPTAGDVNVANNVISVCDSVRASWDPNEKSVSPNGPVSAGTTLSYTIDFENLGNDTAFNIHVQDTLSQHLDPGSFELLASTHHVLPYVYEIVGGKYIIKFDFPGINLEDKTVPQRNKGQVRFAIKLKTGLPDGTVVENRAGIYFDGNPVVLTNIAVSRIVDATTVNLVNLNSGIQVYPNPATDAINIRVQKDGWNEATLSNAVGQVISRVTLIMGDNVLQIGPLPTGIYYLQAKGAAGSYTERVEKR